MMSAKKYACQLYNLSAQGRGGPDSVSKIYFIFLPLDDLIQVTSNGGPACNKIGWIVIPPLPVTSATQVSHPDS